MDRRSPTTSATVPTPGPGGAPAGGPDPAELAHARAAFRGSLEAVRAWRSISPGPPHHDAACWSLLGVLFAEPGLSRTALVGRIVAFAGVSRSTAERVVRAAREDGHVVDRPGGRAVRHFLADHTFRDCLDYFRRHMGPPPALLDAAGRPGG